MTLHCELNSFHHRRNFRIKKLSNRFPSTHRGYQIVPFFQNIRNASGRLSWGRSGGWTTFQSSILTCNCHRSNIQLSFLIRPNFLSTCQLNHSNTWSGLFICWTSNPLTTAFNCNHWRKKVCGEPLAQNLADFLLWFNGDFQRPYVSSLTTFCRFQTLHSFYSITFCDSFTTSIRKFLYDYIKLDEYKIIRPLGEFSISIGTT